MCFILKKDKQKALELVKQKINGEIKITYNEISKQTGYSRMQLSRLSQEVEKKILMTCSFMDLQVRILIIQFPTKRLNILKNSKINIRILVYHNLEIFIMKMLFGIKKKTMMLKNII